MTDEEIVECDCGHSVPLSEVCYHFNGELYCLECWNDIAGGINL